MQNERDCVPHKPRTVLIPIRLRSMGVLLHCPKNSHIYRIHFGLPPPPFFLFLFSTSYSALRTTATLIRKYNNFSERNTSSRQPVEESYPNVADDRSVPQSGSMSFAGRGQPRDRPQTSAPLPPNGHGHGQPATAEYFPHLLHRICLSTWKTGHITPGCPAPNLTTYCTLTVRVP